MLHVDQKFRTDCDYQMEFLNSHLEGTEVDHPMPSQTESPYTIVADFRLSPGVAVDPRLSLVNVEETRRPFASFFLPDTPPSVTEAAITPTMTRTPPIIPPTIAPFCPEVRPSDIGVL